MRRFQLVILFSIFPLILLHASDLDKLVKYNSRHYTFYTQLDNEWNKNLGKMMDAYFEYLCSKFQLRDDGRSSKVIVFTDRKAFIEYGKKSPGNFSENWGGYYTSSTSTPELVIDFDGRHFGVFFHEGLHQIMHRLFPNITYWPAWINEGLAAYMEYTQYTNNQIIFPEQSTWYYRNTALQVKKSGNLKLKDFLQVNYSNWNRSGYDYALGAVLFDFFLNTKNGKYKNLIQQFTAELQRSQSYSSAYSKVFSNVDINELTNDLSKFME